MRSAAMFALLLLSACAATPQPGGFPAGTATCQGEELGSFVGQPASQELGAAMLRASGARTIRWVAQGMAVTMDFSPQRLTVSLTADNRIERASCG